METAGFQLNGNRPIDKYKEKQTYRPLLADERDRFLTSQSCRDDITNYGRHKNFCRFFWTTDWDAAISDEIIGLDASLQRRE